MAYIGVSPSNGVRKKHTYTATASQTSFSGAGDEGITLAYRDSNYVDVYQNGVKLADEDYTATSGTAIVLAQGASADDIVEIIAFDVFSVADTVSKADGGTFDGNVAMAGTLAVTGETTLQTHLNMGDGDIIKLGASADLQIFHDGSDSYIKDAGTGNLTLQGTNLNLYNSALNKIYLNATDGGSVDLYHNNVKKLETTSSGVTVTGGVTTTTASSIEGGAVFNEGGADVDFRVESDDNANMLVVNAGDDIVGIGTATQGRETNLAVVGTDQLPTGAWSQFGIYSNDSYAINKGGSMMFGGQDGTNVRSFFASIKGAKENSTSGNYAGYLAFYTRPAGSVPVERMRVTSAGSFLVGGLTTSNDSLESLQVYANGKVSLSVGRQQDGTLVHFRSGGVNGAAHGEISISGTTCTYGAFTGTHWSRLSDNTMPTILLGTVIENIDEMCDWYQAEFTVEATTKEDKDSESETFGQQIENVAEHIAYKPIELPSGGAVGDTISVTYDGITYNNAVIIKEGDNKHTKCKISDTADSKSVYGVFCAWDLDDDTVNDMKVASLGTHVVRIHKDVTVSKGDLLSSNGDGTAKVQDDDIIRSKTIGKVLTNIKQETYDDDSYTVPCALYCG